MREITSRPQRTIGRSVEVRGVGFVTGANVTLRFVPAPANTGVVFVRTDLTPRVHVPAAVAQVTGTSRRTTLGYLPRCVTLVEHVLAALAGLRIDNCHVEVNAMEPPGMDGSARRFAEVLQAAGVVTQAARRTVWAVEDPVVVRADGATLALHPPRADELRVTYMLEYGPGSPIPPQRRTEVVTPADFLANIAGCRTYLLEAEAGELQRQGLGSRTRLTDLVVFGRHGPIDNTLRWADEPARHKILDVLGDLSLCGHDVRGHVVAYRSGHPLNVELARRIADRLGVVKRPARQAA